MFANYLKIAFRTMRKTKLFTLINILGLAIGIASCLLILFYVNFEKNYDQFHEDKELIYRLRYERYSEDGSDVKFASCTPPAGKRIRERYPEVEKISRIFNLKASVSHKEIMFTEEKIFYMEPEFFEIFNYPFLSGNPVNSLNDPNNAFISASTARKYFGNQDPLGKIISVDKKTDYHIVGVFEDIPQNTHLKFEIILPFKNLESEFGEDYTENWGHTGTYTYLKMKADTDLEAFKTKLADLVETEFGEALEYYNMKMVLPMQPLTEIHLRSHFMQEYEVNGDQDSVDFLSIIAFFVIIIAWVNYINLTAAHSLTRAREVGLRKVVGAKRGQIIAQFFVETLVTNALALIIAFGLVEMSLPMFGQITGIGSGFYIFSQPQIWLVAALLFFVGIIFAGLYPVLVLSSFEPIVVLRATFSSKIKGFSIRKALIVFQFSIALILMAGTFAVYNQLSFMQNQPLGFDMDKVFVVKMPRIRGENYQSKVPAFKEEMLNQANVKSVCVATGVPGRQSYWDAGAIHRAGEDKSKSKNYQIIGIDYDFVDVFNLQILHGRNFSKEFSTDTSGLILNETAIQWMGFENSKSAVGQQVDYWGKIYTIVGVLKDYHQQSLKEDFEPHLFRLMPYGRGKRGLFAFKLNTANYQESIEEIKNKYASFFPGNPYDYFFLDEYFNQQYQADQLYGKVFALFSLLAIFITSLGILALSYFVAIQRTKEVGIRKVMGASVFKILTLFSKDFLILILISFLIAAPLTYYGILKWLNFYAYKMEIEAWLFVLPLLIVSVITLITVGVNSLKTVMANPVESLRYE
jgi:putative ABC transport system permease protein